LDVGQLNTADVKMAVPDTGALLCDVFGTLVDWRGSLLEEAAGLDSQAGACIDWAGVVDDWRRAYQPALNRERAGSAWRDLDSLQHETLTEGLRRHGVTLPAEDRETLVRAWRRLRLWSVVRQGLERLRTRFRTATLSNGHVALLVDLFGSPA
jgi:2-haloacid dehalogenase